MHYPNFGCSIHVDLAKPIDSRRIAILPIQEQLKYADAICRKYAKNPIFLAEQMKIIQEISEKFTLDNETSVGNLAMVAHHNPGTMWEKTHAVMVRMAKNELTMNPNVVLYDAPDRSIIATP